MGADPNDLARLSERLTQLMREKMDIRADSFPAALRRAGRRLPPALRREGQVIRIALEQVQHPRLARIADGAGAARAARRIEAYLAQLDPAADRARRRIFLAADVAFRIAVVLAMFITVLIWRGLV